MSAAPGAPLCFMGCDGATPIPVTLTHSTAFMKTEMSLVPGTMSPETVAFPCPRTLCLEASVHKSDSAGQSDPGPQIKAGRAPPGYRQQKHGIWEIEGPTLPGRPVARLTTTTFCIINLIFIWYRKAHKDSGGGLLPVELSF